MSQDPNLKLESQQTEPQVLTFSADGGDLPQGQPPSPTIVVTPATPLVEASNEETKNVVVEQAAEPLPQSANSGLELQTTTMSPTTAPAYPLEPPPAYQLPPAQVPPYPAQWQPPRVGMDAARYRYLTTPPPLVHQRLTKPQNTASQGAWWGGPIATSGSSYLLRWLLGVVLVLGALVLIFWFFNPFAAQNVVIGTADNAAIATANLVQPTNANATAPGPTLPPTAGVDLVTAQEKWGTVLVSDATVRAVPLETGNITEKLKQNTLLAFEKKSSAGWYMLAGGGWIKREDVRVFASQEAALAAVAQFQATATAAASANPLLTTPTVPPAENISPAELSAKGALTFQTLNCNIKAELSTSNGSKTYYLPNQAAYNSLSMLPPENHRWFCSEQDASNNGFTKANSPILPTFAPTATFGVTQRFPTPRTTTLAFGTPKFLTPTPPTTTPPSPTP